jgi:hypothetical protein
VFPHGHTLTRSGEPRGVVAQVLRNGGRKTEPNPKPNVRRSLVVVKLFCVYIKVLVFYFGNNYFMLPWKRDIRCKVEQSSLTFT